MNGLLERTMKMLNIEIFWSKPEENTRGSFTVQAESFSSVMGLAQKELDEHGASMERWVFAS